MLYCCAALLRRGPSTSRFFATATTVSVIECVFPANVCDNNAQQKIAIPNIILKKSGSSGSVQVPISKEYRVQSVFPTVVSSEAKIWKIASSSVHRFQSSASYTIHTTRFSRRRCTSNTHRVLRFFAPADPVLACSGKLTRLLTDCLPVTTTFG